MIECIAELLNMGVSLGLFSFTPVSGTALADRPPPEPAHYRRIQAAYWLLSKRLVKSCEFRYNDSGRLQSLGRTRRQLAQALDGGAAFCTSGCQGCNRPYYNERPGGFMYNYPRPLTAAESQREIQRTLESLGAGEDA
jgi:biotin synthase